MISDSQQTLLSRLSSLSQYAFNDFVYSIWAVDNCDTDKKKIWIDKLPNVGKHVFEQRTINYDASTRSKASQCSDVIIPLLKPVDLLIKPENYVDFNEEISCIKNYSKLLNKRLDDWYWPNDGEFFAPNILFVSNYSQVHKDFYQEWLLPKLARFVDKNIEKPYSNIGIGSCDSFIEKVPEKTKSVLNSCMSSYFDEVSIRFFDGEYNIENHLSDSYLRSGVLKNGNIPCESVISGKPYRFQEVFDEFKFLLDSAANEAMLEKFITEHYKLIFGNQYDRIETQIWLKFKQLDITDKNRRIDIFLRNAVERDWELVELKKPEKIVKGYRDIPTLTSEVQGAIAQLKNYERLLQQDRVKQVLFKSGIEYFEPELRLVVGRKPNIEANQWRRIKKHNENGLRITTFDTLLEEMKFRIQSILEFDFTDNFK